LALKLFDKFFPAPSWRAWRAWTCGVYGEPMTDEEAAIFREITGRSELPTTQAAEDWFVKGRRAGWTRWVSFDFAFAAGALQWEMAPGERLLFPIVTPSRRQGGIALGYTAAFLEMMPGVVIVRRTVDELELSNGAIIRIETASFRTSRGFRCQRGFVDEAAFLRDDSGANPFREILRALRPSLASAPGSLLHVGSTPYSARDVFYETFERHYGRDGSDILVAQAATRTMNPTIAERIIVRALEEDPASAAAEWGGQFRSDLETLFTRDALAAVTVRGRFELAPMPGAAYVGFLDPAGGSGHDSMTLALAHRDAATGRPILDCVREAKPPFSPEAVCAEFAHELNRYGVRAAFSDNYAAEWPREQFAKLGIVVMPSPLKRSELYLELVPAVQSGACELLDNPRLFNQLADLERRTGSSGRDAVDHRRGQHDDVANAAAGALVMAVQSVGLRAPLPADFVRCNNDAAAGSCAFLMTGPHFPSDPHCRKECPGLRAVWPVYQQYQHAAGAAGEPIMLASAFLRARFEPNALMSRADQERVERWADGLCI
jgi:hypothetical protein